MGGTRVGRRRMARNNPTPCHYDSKNFGVTFLACWHVEAHGPLTGGAHCMFSTDRRNAIVVPDTAHGHTVIGDYRRIVHGNMAVTRGVRLIMTAYTSQSIVDLVTPTDLCDRFPLADACGP